MDHRPFDATHVAMCSECQARAALQAMDVDLERVWQKITDRLPEEDRMATQPNAMSDSSMAMRSPWTLAHALPEPIPNGYGESGSGSDGVRWLTPRGSRKWLPVTMTAALILVLLAGVIWAWRLGSPGPHPGSTGPTGIAPAILAPATPSPAGQDDSLLLEIPLPADVVQDGIVVPYLGYYKMAPGASFSWNGNEPQTDTGTGIWVDYVTAGTLTVTSGDAIELIRADSNGKPEMIPAGQELRLEPGDAVVRRTEGASWANSGSIDVELVHFWVWSGQWFGSAQYPPGWHEVQYAGGFNRRLPAGTYRLRLKHMELEPNEVVPPPPEPGIQFGVAPAPASVVGYLAAGSSGNLTVASAPDTITAYIFTLEAAAERHSGLVNQSPGVEDDVIARADVATMEQFAVTYTGIYRFTLQPGQTLTTGPDGVDGDGLYLFMVESGALTLTADGRAELTPAGTDQATPLARGTDAVVPAGERGVLWPGTAGTWRNAGQEPVVVLNAAIGEATSGTSEVESEEIFKSLSIGWPALPASFAFHRVTLAPGASLPVAALPGLWILGVDAGTLDVPLTTGAGTPARVRGFDAGDGLGVDTWSISAEGEFHNSSSEPAVVYVLLAESTAPPATPGP